MMPYTANELVNNPFDICFFFSLKYINIAMVTILKNMTNILTAVGELYMFRKRQNQKVWTAMFLMVNVVIPKKWFYYYFFIFTSLPLVLLSCTNFLSLGTKSPYYALQIISAVSGSITDLSFDTKGYAWQIVNCILTASYSVLMAFWPSSEIEILFRNNQILSKSLWNFAIKLACNSCTLWQLTLRRVMDKAKQATLSGSLNEVSMVLLNNLLSLPFAMFLILIFDEWRYVMNA